MVGEGDWDMDLKALIAAGRARMEEPPTEAVNVVAGGEGDAQFVSVEVQKLPGADWLTLEAKHPPRVGVEGDERLGANVYAIPADYPVDRIKIEGEPVTVEDWRGLLAILDAVHIENITALMYGLNRVASMMQVEALGKASAGGRKPKPGLPANLASPRGVSKGGNREK